MKKQTLKVILVFLLFSLATVAGAARCKTPRIVPFATEERFTRWSISPVRMTPLDGHVRSFVSPFTVPPEGGFTTIDTSEKQTIWCVAEPCAYGGVPKYADELRDHCWLWGHETGQVDGTNNIWSLGIARSYYHMADAARDFGIGNLNAIRWDKPDKSFRDSLKPLKRVTWPISGNKTEKNYTYDALADWCFAAADEMPNVTGFDLDDFFIASGKSVTVQTATGPALSCPTRFPYEQLVQLRKRLSAYPRPLELRVVTYDELLDGRENPGDLKPSLDLVDSITYWTWKAKNIPGIPAHLVKLRALAPGKPVYLGIYLWDFGSQKEMPLELMEMQLKFALDGWKDGTLEGFVFLCSSICNREFPAVTAARKWVSEHGRMRRPVLPQKERNMR